MRSASESENSQNAFFPDELFSTPRLNFRLDLDYDARFAIKARYGLKMDRQWEDMLDEFRALGGTANNIKLKRGRFGRGLFPIDNSLPVQLHVPDNLLVDRDHFELKDGHLCVRAEAQKNSNEKKFLDDYQRDYSWGVGRHIAEDFLRMTTEASANVQEFIKTFFNADWLASEPNLQAIMNRFFASRTITYNNRHVIAPVLELVNHGTETHFEIAEGINLQGLFKDEIVMRYGFHDPYEIFRNWGFASSCEEFALSLPISIPNARLIIQRGDIRSRAGQPPFLPEVSYEGASLVLSHMVLGHRRYTRLARSHFYKIMRDAGYPNAEEVFDLVQHTNRLQFYRLISVAEDAPPSLGKILREVARHQLEAMSFSIGFRRDPS
jgi:hypothetical protein